MVSDVTIGSALQQQSGTNASTAKLAEDFSQFLTLLTVQLQNQDPLSPMDTTEFTNQLVAFTGVEQQINTNQKLDSLVSLQLGNVMGGSLGYVGLEASYVGSEFFYEGEGHDSTIKYSVDGQAVEGTVRVTDENGEVVYEEPLVKTAGTHDFVWDGTISAGGQAPKGTYEIRIDALDIDDKALNATTVVNGRIRGVENQGGLIYMLIGERAVSQGNILSISEPNDETDLEAANTNETTDETST